jgi:hypothetical protein
MSQGDDVLSLIFWPAYQIFSHGQSQESLRAHVDAKCLPEDFGGLLDPLHGESWMQETGSNLFDCLN